MFWFAEDDQVAVLVSCHYDTVINSTGASDDGVSCAIMLETLRVLAARASPLKHDVVFLFNGAEENILQVGRFLRSVLAEWSKSVAFKPGVSQRRFESGRRQTVTVTACTLWQSSLNLSATSPMAATGAETDVKLNIVNSILLQHYTTRSNKPQRQSRETLYTVISHLHC